MLLNYITLYKDMFFLSCLLLILSIKSFYVCQEIIDCKDVRGGNSSCANSTNNTIHKKDLQDLQNEDFILINESDLELEIQNHDNLEGSGSDNIFSEENCVEAGSNRTCSGRGECISNKCICQNEDFIDFFNNSTVFYHFSGQFCEECPYCRAQRCQKFLPCIECLLMRDKCETVCPLRYSLVNLVSRNIDNDDKFCDMEGSNGCFFRFKYVYDKENDVTLEVEDGFICIAGTKLLIIIFWSVVFYIFVVMIVIPKFCLIASTSGDKKSSTNFLRLPSDIIRMNRMNSE